MGPVSKREIATYIPYTKEQGTAFFLQKRDKDALSLPSYFAFFGGALENSETPEEALRREIKEELTIALNAPRFFCRYESFRLINHVFVDEVDRNFGDRVTVNEGEAGLFLSDHDVLQEKKICDSDRLVLTQLIKTLKGEMSW